MLSKIDIHQKYESTETLPLQYKHDKVEESVRETVERKLLPSIEIQTDIPATKRDTVGSENYKTDTKHSYDLAEEESFVKFSKM